MTTPFYAAFLAIFFAGLSLNVSRLRLKHRISLGAGESPKLDRAIRAHGNFAEHVPLMLILLALAEVTGTSSLALHTLGGLLILARLSHAYCLCIQYHQRLRQFGAILTLILLVVTALLCIG